MSGPIFASAGTSDGIDWIVREDLAEPMIAPAAAHMHELQPPSYWGGPVPYYGDFQLTPNSFTRGLRMVIEFSAPVKQVRATAQFVGEGAFAMYAVVDETAFVGDTFTSPASVLWGTNISGTRTLIYEAGFRFVLLSSVVSTEDNTRLITGPTLRNLYFFETLPVIQPVVAPEPDVRVPRGAGRLLSFIWPPVTSPGVVNPQNLYIRPRASATENYMNEAIVGAPPGGNGTNMVYRGLRCLRMTAGNGTGSYFTPQQLANRRLQIYAALQRGPANLDGLDEMACWRLYGLLAFQQPGGPITRDCGLVIAPGSNQVVRGGAQAGISLGLRDIDTIGVTTKQVDGGPETEHPLLLPSGFDLEDWHTYEMRIISASAAAEATLKILIDDDLMLTLAWGAGTELPDQIAGVALGYTWMVSNLGGSPDFTTTMYVALGGVELACSMTEDGLR